MAKRKKGKPWKPFVMPTRPPSGVYDPALDQTERAAGRGYQDLLADSSTTSARGLDDYTIAQNRLQEHRGQTLQDLLTGYTRGTAERGRQYGLLASSQTQSANAAGVLGGGYAEQAAAKRLANQQREQGLADQDYGTAVTRTNTAADEQLGDIGLTYQHGVEDQGTAITRAGRENAAFSADTNEARWFSARGSGYVPPTAPAGQGFRVGANGQKVPYQRVKGGATIPSGRFLNNSQLRNYLRRRGVR
jgi:hypothetical protein